MVTSTRRAITASLIALGTLMAAGSAPAGASVSQTSIVDDAGIRWAVVDFVAVSSRAYAVTMQMERTCPAAFAGVVFSESTGELTVRLREGVQDAEACAAAAIAETVQAGAAKFVKDPQWTTYSLVDLDRDARVLMADKSWAGQYAGSVVHIWTNESLGAVTIDTTEVAAIESLVAGAQRTVSSRVKVDVVPSGPQFQSRRVDSAPFYASAAMWEASESNPTTDDADCTTNFAWYRSTSVWQGTAGHCNNFGSAQWFHGTTLRWAVSADYEGVGVDAMMLRGLNLPAGTAVADNYLWFANDIDAANIDAVSDANSAPPPINSGMYISGANSGRVYGVVVDTSDPCLGINYTLLDTSQGGGK